MLYKLSNPSKKAILLLISQSCKPKRFLDKKEEEKRNIGRQDIKTILEKNKHHKEKQRKEK